MKNNRPVKNKFNIFSLTNSYYIILENASQKTQGREGNKLESTTFSSRYTEHAPKVF